MSCPCWAPPWDHKVLEGGKTLWGHRDFPFHFPLFPFPFSFSLFPLSVLFRASLVELWPCWVQNSEFNLNSAQNLGCAEDKSSFSRFFPSCSWFLQGWDHRVLKDWINQLWLIFPFSFLISPGLGSWFSKWICWHWIIFRSACSTVVNLKS